MNYEYILIFWFFTVCLTSMSLISLTLCRRKPNTTQKTANNVIAQLQGQSMPLNKVDTNIPYYWMTPEQKEQSLLLCRNCFYSKGCKKSERWLAWKIPERTINFYGSKFHFNEGCNIRRAAYLKDAVSELKRKTISVKTVPFQTDFIERTRTGSEKVYRGMRGGRKYYEYQDTYDVKYRDCLIPELWLKAHENDHKDYEPEITISFDNTELIHMNGNYKAGMIKDAIQSERKKHTEHYTKIGRKKLFLGTDLTSDQVTHRLGLDVVKQAEAVVSNLKPRRTYKKRATVTSKAIVAITQ